MKLIVGTAHVAVAGFRNLDNHVILLSIVVCSVPRIVEIDVVLIEGILNLSWHISVDLLSLSHSVPGSHGVACRIENVAIIEIKEGPKYGCKSETAGLRLGRIFGGCRLLLSLTW